MPRSPKVSVLIPTYNYARYLPETIESVLAQDYPDFELLISDDASPDNSAEVIRGYAEKDPRIRAHSHAANLGMTANWNWCLREARGEYVKFVFGDDLLTSRRALSRLVSMLDSHPGAVLAASARLVINASSAPVEIWERLHRPGLHSGRDVIAQCLWHDSNLVGEPSATIFRRAASGRGFDTGFRQVVDEEMWFHLLCQGDLVYDPEPLCAFRLHPRQQTAANKCEFIGPEEGLRLTAKYLGLIDGGQTSVVGRFRRHRIIHRSLYYSRKRLPRTEKILAVERTLAPRLPVTAYVVSWLLHRFGRPVTNIRRKFIPSFRPGVTPEQLAALDLISPERRAASAGVAGRPPRVLVIRRRYLGDIVLLGSVFHNLRLHWPTAEIAALVESRFYGALDMNPDVDRILVLPERADLWPAFLWRIRRAGYTHVFDFDNNERTAFITRVTGAPFRATIWHEGSTPRWGGLYTHRRHDPAGLHEQRPITEYYLSLLQDACVPVETREIRLVLRQADVEFVRGLLMGVFPDFGTRKAPSLLIHPGSRSICRLWPVGRFSRVCDRVQEEMGARVALVAGPGEESLVESIRAGCRRPPAVISPVLSVPRFAALAAQFDALLCHDSGPMHVAAAVGTRVVALLGSQNPVLFAPTGSGHVQLQPPLPCTSCVDPGICIPGDSYHNLCIRNLDTDLVFGAVRASLGPCP